MGRPLHLLAVLVLALAVRLVSFAEIASSPRGQFHRFPESDMHWFDRWAQEIADGDWLGARLSLRPEPVGEPEDWERWFGAPRYNQAPLYTYVVAGVYALVGHRPAAVLLLQALLGALGCLLVQRIATEAFGAGAGLAAGLLAAGYAPLVFYEGVLLRSALIVFLNLLLVAALLHAGRSRRPRSFVAAGLAIGLASLAQPTILAFAPVALAWVAWGSPGRRARCVGALAVGWLLPLALLVARNLAVDASPFAISSRGPFALVFGHVADTRTAGIGYAVRETSVVEILRRSDYRLVPALRAALATHESWLALLHFEGRKLVAAFSDFEVYNNVNFYYYAARSKILPWLPHFAHAAGLGAVGLAVSLRARETSRRPARVLVALFLLYGLGASLVSLVLSRYRLSLAAALLPYAGLALAWILDAWRARGRLRAAGAVVAAAGVGLLVAWNPIVDLPRMRLVEPLAAARILDREGRPGDAAAEIEATLPDFSDRPIRAARLHGIAARYWRDAGSPARAEAHLARARALREEEVP